MKEWRDLFYYSKSERRALIVLSLVIIGIWITLWISEPNEPCNSAKITENTYIDSLKSQSIKSKDSVIHTKISKPTKNRKIVHSEKRAFQKSFTPKKEYNFNKKFNKGTIVELNSADTLILQKIPGIGPAFSKRIVKYRNLLGGFYSITQLKEVYGIDEEKYAALCPWFKIDTALIQPININQSDFKTLIRHPYLDKEQTKSILKLIRQNGKIQGWNDLILLEEFSPSKRDRLIPYLSFH